MNFSIVKRIAGGEWRTAFRSSSVIIIAVILGFALLSATLIGWQNFKTLNAEREKYREIVAQKWMKQPDRHPHRVSHYGYLVFRPKSDLSFFDFGIDNFAGISLFLEAHRQNTVNFSEAGFSSGMMRFGELSLAMVLQLLVPLLIFFLGFSSVTGERENGTLPILLCQGASRRDILFGKTLGICAVAFALLAPVVVLTLLLWAFLSEWRMSGDSLLRVGSLLVSYTVYFIVCAFAAVLVSAFHKTSRSALTTLVVIWILFCIVMPKATQTLGSKLYQAPSKSEFEAGLEEQISQEGDGHNPDDPKFVKLREDTLREYNVSKVEDLPFNYGGLVMAEGERISSGIFREHYEQLADTFRRQNRITELAGFINPYLAIRNLSMSLAGSDFANYSDFQTQAENYRYNLIQNMNELHKNEIKFAADRTQRVSSANFRDQPAFVYQPKSFAWVLENQKIAVISILFWLAAGLAGAWLAARKLSAI